MPDETQNPAAGDVEIDIDLLERLENYNETLERAGFSKNQREDLLRKYKEYDMELEGKGYEELASIYKEVVKDTIDYKLMHDKDPTWIDNQDLKNSERFGNRFDTPEKLQAEIRDAMRIRDFGRVYEQNQAYDKELKDSGTETYEQLADYYKNLMGVLYHDQFPTGADFERWYEQTDLKSYKHLDTPQELKAAVRDLMTTRDEQVEEYERKQIEEDIEMPSESDEQVGAAGAGTGAAAGDATEDQRLQEFSDSFREREAGKVSDEKDEQLEEAKAPPPVDQSDALSASERVEPLMGFEAALIEGEASSRLIGGGGVLPTEGLRDEAFGGEEDREDGPDAAPAPRANATAPTDPASTDDAVGGAAVEAVGKARGPGETIEGVAGEAILIDFFEAAEDAPFGTVEPGADETSDILAGEWDEDTTSIRDITTTSSSEPVDPLGETVEDAGEALGSPGANIEDATGEAIQVDPSGVAGDAVEHMDDPAVNAVLEDGVEPPFFMEDTIEGGGLGDDVGNEDVVEHMDDPVF